MRAIFISYRRDDTEGQAGRLFQDLSEAFGADMVFMDVTAIEPGIDFRKAIEKNTASCGVLLALIGRNWLGAVDEKGARRLDNPNDFVRLETASALRRDIPVVPVLVHGARMPRDDELPEDLRDLAFRNGVEITHARWESDVQVLIKALRPHVERAARNGDGSDAPVTPPQGLLSPARDPAVQPAPPPAPSPPPPPRPDPGPGRWKAALAGLAAVLVLGGGWAGYGSWQAAQKREQAQRLIAEQKAEADRLAAEKAEADRAAAARAAQEKADADRKAAEKRQADKRLADQLAAEKAERQKREAQEAALKRQQEQAAELERQRQQQLEEERRRLAATREAQIRAHRDGVCISGYVWREARPGDKVCVTPQIRSQTAGENRAAGANRQPGGGAYGPNTCKQGFVWREAFAGDAVCVVPESRTQAARDNAMAAGRVVPLPN